jgi:hypothetical protein
MHHRPVANAGLPVGVGALINLSPQKRSKLRVQPDSNSRPTAYHAVLSFAHYRFRFSHDMVLQVVKLKWLEFHLNLVYLDHGHELSALRAEKQPEAHATHLSIT